MLKVWKECLHLSNVHLPKTMTTSHSLKVCHVITRTRIQGNCSMMSAKVWVSRKRLNLRITLHYLLFQKQENSISKENYMQSVMKSLSKKVMNWLRSVYSDQITLSLNVRTALDYANGWSQSNSLNDKTQISKTEKELNLPNTTKD